VAGDLTKFRRLVRDPDRMLFAGGVIRTMEQSAAPTMKDEPV